MSPELWVVIIAALAILLGGTAKNFVAYLKSRFENSAKRDDPDFQQGLQASLLEAIKEDRSQRKEELSEANRHAEEARIRHQVEMAELEIKHKAELVFVSLESKFEAFRAESDKIKNTREAIIKELQKTVAELKEENATLKREASRNVGGEA